MDDGIGYRWWQIVPDASCRNGHCSGDQQLDGRLRPESSPSIAVHRPLQFPVSVGRHSAAVAPVDEDSQAKPDTIWDSQPVQIEKQCLHSHR